MNIPRKPNQAGFHLVELVVALFILGLAVAAAVPSFTKGNAHRRLEGAAREISARAQYARQKAVARRVPYRMVIDANSQTYSFERQLANLSWVREPDEIYTMQGVDQMSTSIGEGGSGSVIEFETRGTVLNEDAPARITLRNAEGEEAEVLMVRTGRVSVRINQGN